jgi:hypothetical protein
MEKQGTRNFLNIPYGVAMNVSMCPKNERRQDFGNKLSQHVPEKRGEPEFR